MNSTSDQSTLDILRIRRSLTKALFMDHPLLLPLRQESYLCIHFDHFNEGSVFQPLVGPFITNYSVCACVKGDVKC